MKRKPKTRRDGLIARERPVQNECTVTLLPLLLASTVFPVQEGPVVRLQALTEGASKTIGFYMPQRLTLSDTKPAGVKAIPADFSHPRYGELEIGGHNVALVLDEPEGRLARLVVDGNNDGDLRNDGLVEWKGRVSPAANGKTSTMYMGSFRMPMRLGGASRRATLTAYRFDPTDPARAQLKDTLLYYRDYAMKGELALGGKRYPVILSDEMASGRFVTGQNSRLTLLVDRDGDGRFKPPAEQFDANKPFSLDGVSYEIADLATDGSSFRLAKAKAAVAEVPLPPNVAIGRNVVAFEAETTKGEKISFPNTYKGKIVMLDFWATWCGPCIGELPNVKKAYAQFHDQGFEILSISLDKKEDGGKLAQFTKENNMPWSQVFDGGFWDARVARLYGVQAIPFVLLVDGDTGKILADASTLRGPQITETIEKALKAKRG
jgi:peroxiredoxin